MAPGAERNAAEGRMDEPAVLQEKCTHPILVISGMAANQAIGIVESEADFFSETSSQWSQVLPGPWVTETFPVWDVAPRDGRSDVDFALQCWPTLLLSGAVMARGQVSSDPGSLDFAFPRTAVGVGPPNPLRPGTVVWLVVADGEGVNGGNGATFNQLAELFRDVLGARAVRAAAKRQRPRAQQSRQAGPAGWRRPVADQIVPRRPLQSGRRRSRGLQPHLDQPRGSGR